MHKGILLGALAGLAVTASAASATTLDDVKARGALKCGVNVGLAGFSAPDQAGRWQGFDVDYCRALAAAIFGDQEKVEFTPATTETRFTALVSGEIDVLARNSTWTFSRDVDLKLDFVGVNYYDGQGFMVSKDLGVTSAKELDGATICIQTGTTTELNLADFFKTNGMSYQPVPIQSESEARQQFLGGACDAYTTDASGLAAARSGYPNPDNYIILPEIISKEPLGPVVRHGDNQWADIGRWTLNALIEAEELGITKANIDEMKGSQNPEVRRLLGVEGSLGKMFGLSDEWAYNAIKANGNYGEIFTATIGEGTPSNLDRGLNAQWKDGGLLYSPPFR
ncbi:MAG TPA: amino acid ABC transporter substrate-binding protein [Amaricoccus sp.]|nr:amino acid ABC transporter substrate-binding protein [Amaricoccus sp.]